MFQSLWMAAQDWMHAPVTPNRLAWLWLGSVQLAVLGCTALGLNRWLKESAVSSHRLWLAALLLTIGCLPIHALSLGWMPVGWSLSESRQEPPALTAAAPSAPVLPSKSTSSDSQATPATSALIEVPSSTTASTKDQASFDESSASSNVEAEKPTSAMAVDIRGLSNGLLKTCTAIYSIVVFWMMIRILIGLHKLKKLFRGGRTLDADSVGIFASVAARLQLRSPVEVRAVERLSMPAVFGVFDCRVLVPGDFEQWSVAEQESVAFHELTHITRRDTLVEVVSQLLCAIYWFHPASWLIRAKLRDSRERATDEMVLRHGLSASSYAHSLVAILSRLSAESQQLSTTPAVAMSLCGDVERRILDILTSSTAKRFHKRSLSLIIVLCVMAGITCFRLVAVEPTSFSQPPQPAVAASTTNKDNDDQKNTVDAEVAGQRIVKAPSPNELWATIEENENDLLSRIRDCEILTVDGDDYHSLLTVEGQVRDPSGQPVEGAIVLLRESSTWRISAEPMKYIDRPNRHLVRTHDVFARTITDLDGNYRFDKVKAPAMKFGNPWRGSLVAGHPKLGVGWLNLPTKGERVRFDLGMTIALAPVTKIEGHYVTPANQPLEGVVMNLYKFYASRDDFTGVNTEFDLQASQLTPRDTTTADGSFGLLSLPIGLMASVGGSPKQDWLSGGAMVSTSGNVKPSPYVSDLFERKETTVVTSPCVIKADPGVNIDINVVNAEKKPISGVRVLLASFVDGVYTDDVGQARQRVHSSILSEKSGRTPYRLYIQTSEESEYLPRYVQLSMEQIKAAQPIEVVLERCVRVSGVVHDQANQPVDKVQVRQAGDVGSALARATTLTDGRYTIKLPPGEHTLLFASDEPGFDLPPTSAFHSGRDKPFTDFPRIMVDVSDGQAKDVGTFTVTRIGAIDVKVLLPDGRAAVGADVVIMDSDVSQVPMNIPRPIPSLRNEVSKHVLTDELGQAMLLPTGKPTRRATVQAKLTVGKDCFISEATIPEANNGRIEVRLQLQPTMKIEGQVLKDGKPLVGAIVRIEEHNSIGNGGVVRRNVASAVTDGDGWYRTTGEVGRQYIARLELVPGLEQPPNANTPIESSTQDVLRFSPISLKTYHEEIIGVVLNKQRQPVEGAKVRIMGPTENWFEHLATSQMTTNANGQFHLKNIPAGQYHLEVMVPLPQRSGLAQEWMSATYQVRAGNKQAEIFFNH